jgi:ring-1,2-phenylacetyl-CoA epoxidase subunit PaaC
MAAPAPLFEYLLRLGDNCLILGHRLSEWCGHGPVLEEDLALTNVALDLIGQATLWLDLAGQIEGRGRDADRLAYRRDAHEFRNLLLVEQPNGHYGDTLARQFYFDTWHYHLLQGLVRSQHAGIAEIAAKSLKEVTYHLERSGEWVVTLGDGTAESHARIQQSLDDLWMYTGELFEMDALEQGLTAEGIAVDARGLREPWLKHVQATLEEATLTPPPAGWMQQGGKRGVHSENLGFILADMQFLQRAYPNATAW